jgi:hypothetical protein
MPVFNTYHMITNRFHIVWNYITLTPNSLISHVTSFEKLLHSCTLNNTQLLQYLKTLALFCKFHRNKWENYWKMTVNNELERMWKESGIICFKILLSICLSRQENHKKASARIACHQTKIQNQDLPHIKVAWQLLNWNIQHFALWYSLLPCNRKQHVGIDQLHHTSMERDKFVAIIRTNCN